MTSDKKFKHSTPIEIRFKDLDSFKHVNNANFLTYIEQARIKYFNDVLKNKYEWSKEGVILAKAIIDFKLPLYLNDKIIVHTKCSRLGNKSMDLEYLLIREKDSKEAALAHTVLVAFNYENNQSIKIPEEWKNKILAFEEIIL